MSSALSVRPVVTQALILGSVVTVLLVCTATLWQLVPNKNTRSPDQRNGGGCLVHLVQHTPASELIPFISNSNSDSDSDIDSSLFSTSPPSFTPQRSSSSSSFSSFYAPEDDRSDQIRMLKEPNTPPKSLPSDIFAQYIYRQELRLSEDCKKDAGSGEDENKDSYNDSWRTDTRRTFIVGDVHGTLSAFDAFLQRVRYQSEKDVVVLAGDLVSKGPQSLELLDRAIQVNAKCVRGNHDDKVVRWRGYLDSLSPQEQEDLDREMEEQDKEQLPAQASDDDDDDNDSDTRIEEDSDSNNDSEKENVYDSDDNESSPLRRHPHLPSHKIPWDLDKRSEHYRLARRMTKAQYNYLRNCPLILTLPREISVHDVPIHVVHAGIDPRRDILEQQPWVLLNIRNVLSNGIPSRKKSQGRGWAREFNDMHNKRHSSNPPGSNKRDFIVVYGHDAGRSLNVKSWSIGVDTGCIYGRHLTGYVVETGQIVNVRCHHE